MIDTQTDTPRAWVGCLGCYNAGALVGAWVDGIEAGDYEPHDTHSVIPGPPCGSVRSDERWVMDHENYGGLLDGECSPSEAQKMAETIEHIESCGIPVEAVAAYRDHVGPGYFDPSVNSLDDFSDAYQGEWKDEEDFAYELAKDIGFTEPDTWPGSYIDWERATRDLFLGDYWSAEAPGGIYVFRS